MPEKGKCSYVVSDISGKRYCKKPTVPGYPCCEEHYKYCIEIIMPH